MHLLTIILSILTALFSQLESHTLQADFSATETQQDQSMHYAGSFTVRGQSFLFEMDDTQAAFDGKTMYMYSSETDELTLTEPTEQELMESNPFLFAQAMVDLCTITERKSEDGLYTFVTMKPTDAQMGVTQFVLKVRNADLMPMKLEVREGQSVSVVELSHPGYVSTAPSFVIEPGETTFVNDLRF